MKKKEKISEEEAMKCFSMILIGLHFLHFKMNIAHRDLHPKNIMIDSLPGGVEVFKIGDFGLSNLDNKEP